MIVIALGANLPSKHGNPAQTLEKAVEALQENGLEIIAKSRIYLTAPVPISDQPWYHNSVISVKTELDAFQLLGLLHKIENEFGRIRTIRNAPRVLDLDLISYNDQIIDKPELIVPHPRMHERAFVLYPMSELGDNWKHPLTHKTINMMINEIPKDQEIKIA